jgi:hypothetical protein
VGIKELGWVITDVSEAEQTYKTRAYFSKYYEG